METTPSRTLLAEPLHPAAAQRAARSLPPPMQWRLYVGSLILSDVIMVGLAFRAAYFVRFQLSLELFELEVNASFAFYQKLILILIPTWLVLFALAGLYDRRKLLGGTEEYALVFNATLIGMFLVIAAGFLDPNFIFARGWLLLAWGLAFLFTALGRFALRRIVYGLRAQGFFLSAAVIVGANSEGLSLAEQLTRWKTSGLHLLGFVDTKLPAGTPLPHNLRVLGTVEQLDDLIAQYGVEELILASSATTSRDNVTEIFQRYGVNRNINVRMSSGLYEIITTGLTVKEFAYVPLVGINPVRLTGVDRIIKATLDYFLTIPVLILSAPLLLVIALAIKLDSPGPAIHRRRVMGLNGRRFAAYKFRTMYVNGDEIMAQHPDLSRELARNHKLKRDPRVTRVGLFLRRSSLDELPQLFNILRREMSLVGPRIIAPEEVGKYSQSHLNLMTVRPGLTGLWQVSGRADVSYEERVRLDMYYIRNWSLWLDLQILLQTLPAVVQMRGAY